MKLILWTLVLAAAVYVIILGINASEADKDKMQLIKMEERRANAAYRMDRAWRGEPVPEK